MPWLSQKDIRRVHDAVVRGGVDPSAVCCGLDPRLTATLPGQESRCAQLLSDLHELNRIGCLMDGTRPVKVWMQTGLALLGARTEAVVLRAILKKVHAGTRDVTQAPEHWGPATICRRSSSRAQSAS